MKPLWAYSTFKFSFSIPKSFCLQIHVNLYSTSQQVYSDFHFEYAFLSVYAFELRTLTLVWYVHEFLQVYQKIILVQYVHEFLKLLGKRLCLFDMFMSFYKFSIKLYLYFTICTCVFKVIREKIILVQYVHEFLKL